MHDRVNMGVVKQRKLCVKINKIQKIKLNDLIKLIKWSHTKIPNAELPAPLSQWSDKITCKNGRRSDIH